jgi:hypothetical protein
MHIVMHEGDHAAQHPSQIQKVIRAKAKQQRISMNRAVLELLEERVGEPEKKRRRVYDDLDDLFGTWTDAEADEFDKALQEQRQIDIGVFGIHARA